VLPLVQRTLSSKLRHPTTIVADVVSPLLLIAVFTAAFGGIIHIRGFPPVRSYLDFGLVGTVVIGVFFSASDVGEAVAIDVEHGFFDRLLVSPVPRGAILMGALAGSVVLAMVECLFFLAVLSIFGAAFEGGAPAVVTITAVMTMMALATGALTTSVGLASGTAGSFGAYVPVSLAAMFISSAYFPRSLMKGWFRTLAGLNPVSWLVEDLRYQVIVGFDRFRAARALGMVSLLAVASVGAAARALRGRASGK